MYRGHMNVWVCTKIGGIQTPPMYETCLPLGTVEKSLFKANFLHLRNWKMIRDPPDCTGNEPTLDIPMGGSGKDIKKEQNDKYMPFVRTC